MDIVELVDVITNAAHDIKAEDVEVYNVKEKSTIVDYHVVCSANTYVQINAIVRNISDALKNSDQDFKVDGQRGNLWVAIDAGPIMVHVMTTEEREKYELDELWSVTKIIYH